MSLTYTVKNALIKGKTALRELGVDTFSIDAELLLAWAIAKDRLFVLTNGEYMLSGDEYGRFSGALEKRKNGVPIAYITGEKEFMSLNFLVNSDTLIPRPDTEVLTEFLIDAIKKNGYKTGIEIGAGSGAIAVSVCKYCPGFTVVACDISERAVITARKNAVLNGVEDMIRFVVSDLFQNIEKTPVDVIFSNPPYIKTSDLVGLTIEVLKEPLCALDGGADGLDFYRRITAESRFYLRNNGVIAYETGFDEGLPVKDILAENGFRDIRIFKDLAGNDRVVAARRT